MYYGGPYTRYGLYHFLHITGVIEDNSYTLDNSRGYPGEQVYDDRGYDHPTDPPLDDDDVIFVQDYYARMMNNMNNNDNDDDDEYADEGFDEEICQDLDVEGEDDSPPLLGEEATREWATQWRMDSTIKRHFIKFNEHKHLQYEMYTALLGRLRESHVRQSRNLFQRVKEQKIRDVEHARVEGRKIHEKKVRRQAAISEAIKNKEPFDQLVRLEL